MRDTLSYLFRPALPQDTCAFENPIYLGPPRRLAAYEQLCYPCYQKGFELKVREAGWQRGQA